ncbi:hypothetical protein [Nonomuraea sp. NPDC005650]|uniref:hypothetical protein n=1 Tax=Nonomuraea sp. NPDC005650 TaxID=3157045 RepID=UPI0033A34744
MLEPTPAVGLVAGSPPLATDGMTTAVAGHSLRVLGSAGSGAMARGCTWAGPISAGEGSLSG